MVDIVAHLELYSPANVIPTPDVKILVLPNLKAFADKEKGNPLTGYGF